MPLVVKDRVLETTITTGTGTLTLAGATTGYQTFSSAIGNGNTTYYTISSSSEWEVGIGTVGAGTLTRDTVLESSNSGSLVNFGAGTKNVFCTYPAEKAVDTDISQTLTNKTISGASNTLSNIGNSSLTNSSVTINGTSVALGGSISVGTVTSVSGTSPVSSSGGNTPAISLASGYGDTQNPYASKTANFFLAAPNGTAGVPTFRAIVAADVPTLNQNTTGTASNVTGTVAIANGGTGATTAANARTNLGATTAGSNFFTLTNPSAITFPRINADNTVSALDAATFRSAIGAGTGNGTVTSVSGTGTVNGISLSGTVTSSGSLTLGGTLSNVSLSSQVTGTLPVANGGTGATTGFKLFDSSFTSNINANTNRTVGAYGSYASSATNTPTGSGILYNFTSATDGSGDGGQFWQDYVTNNLYLRQRWGGTYGSWLTMVSASNISSYAVTSVSAGTGISVSASTGSVTITNTSPNQLTTTAGSPAYYGARAWVNFNGTGTVAIRGSINVSSITDNGTGSYTINFTTAMPDVNYNAVGASARASNDYGYGIRLMTFATGSLGINTLTNGANTLVDFETICITVFR